MDEGALMQKRIQRKDAQLLVRRNRQQIDATITLLMKFETLFGFMRGPGTEDIIAYLQRNKSYLKNQSVPERTKSCGEPNACRLPQPRGQTVMNIEQP